MTKRILSLACLLTLLPTFAQSPQPPVAGAASSPPRWTVDPATGVAVPLLTKFSLDFPGGTPKELVTAIEKATGKPLNAIIPPEHADAKLPQLKLNNVDVQQLFAALERVSFKSETYATRGNSYQIANIVQGFKTQGPLSDESIWYFWVDKPALPPAQVSQRVCRYFSLVPYLEDGQTVDDITTAIQTGWKMLGDKETPTISFHKETKLLIAVGEPEKLETIDAVLRALQPTFMGVDPATGLPVRAGAIGAPSKP